jgi:HAE1 family hydrophobic/amphiphilic exporter-1
MIEQAERTDDASVYAAKMKRRKVLVGAKVKQFQ